jgi:hypothetical protein
MCRHAGYLQRNNWFASIVNEMRIKLDCWKWLNFELELDLSNVLFYSACGLALQLEVCKKRI